MCKMAVMGDSWYMYQQWYSTCDCVFDSKFLLKKTKMFHAIRDEALVSLTSLVQLFLLRDCANTKMQIEGDVPLAALWPSFRLKCVSVNLILSLRPFRLKWNRIGGMPSRKYFSSWSMVVQGVVHHFCRRDHHCTTTYNYTHTSHTQPIVQLQFLAVAHSVFVNKFIILFHSFVVIILSVHTTCEHISSLTHTHTRTHLHMNGVPQMTEWMECKA